MISDESTREGKCMQWWEKRNWSGRPLKKIIQEITAYKRDSKKQAWELGIQILSLSLPLAVYHWAGCSTSLVSSLVFLISGWFLSSLVSFEVQLVWPWTSCSTSLGCGVLSSYSCCEWICVTHSSQGLSQMKYIINESYFYCMSIIM